MIVIAAIAVVALAACASDPDPASSEADTPDPTTTDPTAEAGRQPEGFTTIQALITETDGEVCEVCLWLADDSAERGRGLMGVTDLGVAFTRRFDVGANTAIP